MTQFTPTKDILLLKTCIVSKSATLNKWFCNLLADTMVPDEIDEFKSLIMQQIHQAKIKESLLFTF